MASPRRLPKSSRELVDATAGPAVAAVVRAAAEAQEGRMRLAAGAVMAERAMALVVAPVVVVPPLVAMVLAMGLVTAWEPPLPRGLEHPYAGSTPPPEAPRPRSDPDPPLKRVARGLEHLYAGSTPTTRAPRVARTGVAPTEPTDRDAPAARRTSRPRAAAGAVAESATHSWRSGFPDPSRGEAVADPDGQCPTLGESLRGRLSRGSAPTGR